MAARRRKTTMDERKVEETNFHGEILFYFFLGPGRTAGRGQVFPFFLPKSWCPLLAVQIPPSFGVIFFHLP
jgi:hypothetical protein